MPPVLEEKHVEEILLRVKPHQAAGLFRHAALVCKRWWRLISSPGFRRRYRKFHLRPLLRAFFANGVADDGRSRQYVCSAMTRPGTAFCRCFDSSRYKRALDVRHGRILLQRVEEEEDTRHGRNGNNPFKHAAAVEGAREFFVSVVNPMVKRHVPIPSLGLRTLAAAVLCADTTGACDHLDCHRGHFLVVLVGCLGFDRRAFIYTYSSETATWNVPISTLLPIDASNTVDLMPSAYVGNALYFGFRRANSILKYDLQLGQISWIQLPSMCTCYQPNVLTTTTEAAGVVLGLATIRGTKLYIWSRKDTHPQKDDDAIAGWTQTRIIELQTVLTVDDLLPLREPYVLGDIFFWVNGTIHAINLRTFEAKKICNDSRTSTIYTLIPYVIFRTPPGE